MSQKGSTSPLVWTAMGVLVLLTGAVVYTALWHPAAARPCPAEPAAKSEQPDAGLSVRFEHTRIHIAWDARSAVIQSAQDGVLLIRDGSERRAFPLDAAALASGGYWYTPGFADLLVRMTVYSTDTGISESARIVLSDRPKPAQAEAKEPAPGPLRSFTVPVPIRKVQPAPSAELRRRLAEPLVIRVRLRVDEGGNVAEADTDPLPDRTANALAQAAVQAALQWAFEPARRNGIPVQCGFSVSFRFTPLN